MAAGQNENITDHQMSEPELAPEANPSCDQQTNQQTAGEHRHLDRDKDKHSCCCCKASHSSTELQRELIDAIHRHASATECIAVAAHRIANSLSRPTEGELIRDRIARRSRHRSSSRSRIIISNESRSEMSTVESTTTDKKKRSHKTRQTSSTDDDSTDSYESIHKRRARYKNKNSRGRHSRKRDTKEKSPHLENTCSQSLASSSCQSFTDAMFKKYRQN
ncbi:uncharacterized protein LOC142986623 [Anticarsia gemmatalis]|uniref:uncharacterized protein LOC142986623 n=1 Tax=Anticarsia gemmatalis TaxID=129554 RepID=UPI003F7755F9